MLASGRAICIRVRFVRGGGTLGVADASPREADDGLDHVGG